MPEALSALTVSNPSAWWALLALGIPLLIHLFSKSRGRLVRIGHIDLIRHARKLQVTELKLTQWLLLLLRLAIFTLAGLILTGLATQGLNSSNANTIYLTPSWLSHASTEDLTSLFDDAGQVKDSRIILLQAGFPAINREQLEAGNVQTGTDTQASGDTWALLAERLSLENHRGEVMVYATDHILQFGSHRPDLPRHVNWRIAHPGNTSPLVYRPVRALIVFSKDRTADASRLAGVFSTLRAHRLPELTWESVASEQLSETGGDYDWVILLRDDDLGSAIIEKFKASDIIFSDANGSAPEIDSQFISLPFYPFTRFRLDHYTRTAVQNTENTLLTTASGSPLLQESYTGQTRLIQFNSRFDPAWNSLTQQAEFPELFLQLISNNKENTQRYTDARLSELNLQNPAHDATVDIPLPRRSLQTILAAMLTFLWVFERWLSERTPRGKR